MDSGHNYQPERAKLHMTRDGLSKGTRLTYTVQLVCMVVVRCWTQKKH